MSSLTPEHRSAEAVSEASYEGMMNGIFTMIPTGAAVALAIRNSPGFALRTNWQSRTAMTIMPAMFVAALTSEHKLSHRMREIATETHHSTETVKWAEEQWKQSQQQQQQNSNMTETQHLSALYQQSIESTGVRVIPELHWYHKAANFTATNPIKVLTAAAVPTVGYIFYGRADQNHLQLSSKLMHTRVFGQFATISLLLGIMGFKEFMDQNGRYMSQQQADDRVEEMQMVRMQLLHRLEQEKLRADDLKSAIAEAHQQDVKEHNVHHDNNNTGKKKKKKAKKIEQEDETLMSAAIATTPKE